MITEGISEVKKPWSIGNGSLSELMQVSENDGLSISEANKRLQIFGHNRITSEKKISPFIIFLKQFISPFAFLLVAAAGLSFVFNEWLNGAAILSVVFINAAIGFWMEFQAVRSMDALKKMITMPARVLRDGNLSEISSEELVPGDVLFLEAGDMVAADARITKSVQLQVDESALTGESFPVEKEPGVLTGEIPLAERTNMLYKGTQVLRGNGYAIVTSTGMKTELGVIAGMIQNAEQAATPLERKIQSFSKKLIWITVVLIATVFIAGVLNGQPIVQMLKTSIALAVAAIPEGLPIVATLALAIGMIRMAKKNVIVKRLSSVETLGGVTIICTDKTGTLTRNEIEAAFVSVHGRQSRISLANEANSISWDDDPGIENARAFEDVIKIAALCNNSSYVIDRGEEKSSGDPLEIGLLKMVLHSGKKLVSFQNSYPREGELPFTSETKVMATLHRNNDYYVAAKGAVEELLSYCSKVHETDGVVVLDQNKKQLWLDIAEQQAATGLKILAFAYKNCDTKQQDFLSDLTFAGLVGFIDPPRLEVPAAIEECKNAGIKVVMITGDHPATARNIAQRLGLIDLTGEVIHSRNMKPFNELTGTDREIWMKATVFARTTPEQKLDLVRLYQENKMIVGMTGDGVNDAPALKKSDIGIAMGKRGTQVAQEVSDMVLKDDSFSSIVLAIRLGRGIFDNIRKFVVFLLSCNLSELFIVSTAAVLNLPFQLLPLQILYINLLTDVLPALALGVTAAPAHIMKRKPHPPGTPIIDRKRWISIFVYAAVITFMTVSAVFASHELLHNGEGWDGELYNNTLFYTLIFSQLLNVFNMSFGKQRSFFKSEVFQNRYVWYAIIICVGLALIPNLIPAFGKIMGLHLYGWKDWCIVIAFSFLSMLVIQFIKRRGVH